MIGSSSGIGAALVRALADAGVEVTATVRPSSPTPGGALPRVRTLALDVTDDAAVRAVVGTAEPLDILAYNAGYGVGGVLEEVDDAALVAQYEVNVFGFWRAARAALPGMRAAGGGTVVAIGSFGSRMPFPGIAAYRSSKAALASVCAALRLEVAGFGIRVLHVQPGLVRTRFDANMVDGAQVDRDGPYAPVYRAAAAAYPLMSPVAQEPERVADRIVRALGDPDGPLDLPIGEDAERMLAWADEGHAALEDHIATDLGYDWHRGRPGHA